jgi:predicted alpha/beta superfamily hydrolase
MSVQRLTGAPLAKNGGCTQARTTNFLMKRLLAILALTLTAAMHAAEANPTFPPHVLKNTQIRPLPRSANGRDYQLFVALPPDYGTSGKRYPVLYICDGYWDFTLINGFYGNLRYDQVVPDFIVVGFGYQHVTTNAEFDELRRYDYTPTADPKDPRAEHSGHAADFLAVVEHEFIPFVESEYRVDSTWRVLSGNSLGGLFSLYAMLARPGLFQGHVAASPACPSSLFELENKFAASGAKLSAYLFMSGAEKEWPDFLANIKRFNARLQSRHYPGFHYQWRLIEGEGHTGTKAESYNRGLRFTFGPVVGK